VLSDVTGRHHATGRPGRRRLAIAAQVLTAAIAVVTVLAVSFGAYRTLTRPRCGGNVSLSIAAAPEIAPAIQATAARWTATRPTVRDKCVSVKVAAADSAGVAAAIAGQHDAVLNRVGHAAGGTTVPDVWVPDSSVWLSRLRTVGSGWVPDDPPSIARSPVVLAMPEPIAATLGWPDKKLGWGDVVPRLISDPKLLPGIVEPHRDAAGLCALLALTGTSRGAAADQLATVKMLRRLATGDSVLKDDLLARFPRSTDQSALASGLSVVPLSEQTLIGYNRRLPPVRLAGVYPGAAGPTLDYPFVVLPGGSADKRDAARQMLSALSAGSYRDQLAASGLRPADGTTGAGLARPIGAPDAVAATGARLDPAAVDTTLSAWTAITSPGRLLAVIDVSGSMLQPVPSAGGATREQVTTEAARQGLALLDDSWTAGLWIFSTRLDGAADHRQLAPIAPVASQRHELLNALSSVRPKRDGGTGLYDTTLAAYKAVAKGWDPSRSNSVVIMTDGRNDDRRGRTLDQLINELKRTMDPARPIQVVAIGVGDQVSEPELKRITETTGGGTFIVPDPSTIGDVFLKAIALRTTVKR
jgi:Ca-activated chloride channel family protein